MNIKTKTKVLIVTLLIMLLAVSCQTKADSKVEDKKVVFMLTPGKDYSVEYTKNTKKGTVTKVYDLDDAKMVKVNEILISQNTKDLKGDCLKYDAPNFLIIKEKGNKSIRTKIYELDGYTYIDTLNKDKMSCLEIKSSKLVDSILAEIKK